MTEKFFLFLPSLESSELQFSEQASCVTKHLFCFLSPSLPPPWVCTRLALGSVFQRTQVKSGGKITNTCKTLRASLHNTIATTSMWLLSTGNVVSMNQDVLCLKKKKTNWDFKNLAQQKSHNFILVIYWKDNILDNGLKYITKINFSCLFFLFEWVYWKP